MTTRNLVGILLVVFSISSGAKAQTPRSALEVLKSGNAALAAERWQDAVVEFTRAIQLNTRNANCKTLTDNVEDGEIAANDALTALAFNNRGIAHYGLGDYEKAMADFDRAIRIEPRLADAYNNRGNVWQAKGELEKALQDYSQAIKLNPGHSRAFNNCGNIRQAKGQLDAALRDYNRSIELNPENALAFANRGLTLEQLERGTEASADFRRALQLDPSIKLRLETLIRVQRTFPPKL